MRSIGVVSDSSNQGESTISCVRLLQFPWLLKREHYGRSRLCFFTSARPARAMQNFAAVSPDRARVRGNDYPLVGNANDRASERKRYWSAGLKQRTDGWRRKRPCPAKASGCRGSEGHTAEGASSRQARLGAPTKRHLPLPLKKESSPTMEKRCLACGEVKPLSGYWVDAVTGNADVIPPAKHCIACHEAGLVPFGYGPGNAWRTPAHLDNWCEGLSK